MIISCADAFVENYVGGAELTTEAILNSSSMPIGRILSHDLTIDILKQFSHRFWIFVNLDRLKNILTLSMNVVVKKLDMVKLCQYFSHAQKTFGLCLTSKGKYTLKDFLF